MQCDVEGFAISSVFSWFCLYCLFFPLVWKGRISEYKILGYKESDENILKDITSWKSLSERQELEQNALRVGIKKEIIWTRWWVGCFILWSFLNPHGLGVPSKIRFARWYVVKVMTSSWFAPDGRYPEWQSTRSINRKKGIRNWYRSQTAQAPRA